MLRLFCGIPGFSKHKPHTCGTARSGHTALPRPPSQRVLTQPQQHHNLTDEEIRPRELTDMAAPTQLHPTGTCARCSGHRESPTPHLPPRRCVQTCKNPRASAFWNLKDKVMQTSLHLRGVQLLKHKAGASSCLRLRKDRANEAAAMRCSDVSDCSSSCTDDPEVGCSWATGVSQESERRTQ